MKALSINQPFGWAIAEGFKDIENRSWATNYRGEFYIHVGLNVQTGEYPMIRELTGSPSMREFTTPTAAYLHFIACGGIIK